MKKYLSLSLSAAVLSLGLITTVPVYAEHQLSQKKCMMKKVDEMKTELGITAEQEAKLEMLREQNMKFMKSKQPEMRDIHHKADMIAEEKDIDMKKLDMLAEKAGKLKGEMLKHRVMMQHDIREVLTPKQREMIKMKMMEHMKNT